MASPSQSASACAKRQLMGKIAGKANDAVIRLLAMAWQVPKTSLSVAANRLKTIHAVGETEDLI